MQVRDTLRSVGAVLTDDHFVYQKGEHGPDYVAKDILITRPFEYADVANEVAALVHHLAFTVVCGVEKGAIALGFCVAHELIVGWGQRDLRYVYAEKELGPDGKHAKRFYLGRGFPEIVKGANVLITEDILNTGDSVEGVIAAVREAGGNVVGVVAICNRGGVTAEQLGVPFVEAGVNVLMPKYPAVDCPLCKAGKPINVEFGHGKAFVATNGQPVEQAG